MFDTSDLIESAATTGTVGGQFVTGGPQAGQPLYWNVSSDSKKRWKKGGLKVKPRLKKNSAKNDEEERQKWIKKFGLLSLYRRNPITEAATAKSVVAKSTFRIGDRTEIQNVPITNQNKGVDDLFLKGSFLDKTPHKSKDTERLSNGDWDDIQKHQNKSTSDPMWVWKRRLRYAGAMKDHGESEVFEASELLEGSKDERAKFAVDPMGYAEQLAKSLARKIKISFTVQPIRNDYDTMTTYPWASVELVGSKDLGLGKNARASMYLTREKAHGTFGKLGYSLSGFRDAKGAVNDVHKGNHKRKVRSLAFGLADNLVGPLVAQNKSSGIINLGAKHSELIGIFGRVFERALLAKITASAAKAAWEKIHNSKGERKAWEAIQR